MKAYIVFKEAFDDGYVYSQYATIINKLERTKVFAYSFTTNTIVSTTIWPEMIKMKIPILNISEEQYFYIHSTDKLHYYCGSYFSQIVKCAVQSQNKHYNSLISCGIKRRNYKLINGDKKIVKSYEYFIVLKSKNRYILCKINTSNQCVELINTLAILPCKN